MSSAERLAATDRILLLEIAEKSLRHGLAEGIPLPVEPNDYTAGLQVYRATFVTLESNGRLRGCIGTLAAIRPLIGDVAHNAFAAGFHDPRFLPLSEPELEGLALHISVLSKPEPLEADSEETLLAQLRPGIDGLILTDLNRRSTFLPTVWESLPDPQKFLGQLKMKAGLPPNYWSATLRFQRYTTEIFGRTLPQG